MAEYCDRSNELVPDEDIPYHQMGMDPISSGEEMAVLLDYLQENTDPKSSDENQQEMTRTPMSKVRKRYPKVSDMEQPLLIEEPKEQPLEQPKEQPLEQPKEQPKEQPPEGNESTEKVKQSGDVPEKENLSAFVKHLIVYEGLKPCCYCCTCCDCCSDICPDCCNCPTCFSCCPRCCPTFKTFPDTNAINEARQAGTFALLKFLVLNLFWPILREIIVYGGLILLIGLFCYNLGVLVYILLRDKRQIKKTLQCIKLTFSAFGLLFSFFDAGLHFRHYGFRLAKRCIAFRTNYEELDLDLDIVKPDEAKYEFFNKKLIVCNNLFGKGFVAFMDVIRIFVLETIFYPNLLISVFEFIIELDDNDYIPSMISWTTWLSAVFGFLASLFLVYVHRVFTFARVIYLIGKQIKEYTAQGIMFLIIFVAYMYMMLFLQILMIVIIGSRFHHEYVNDRAIEMSWQLWYMMISAYLLPLLGIFMFFLVHHFWTTKLPVDVIYNLLCKFQAKGEKEYKDEDTHLKDFKEVFDYLGGDKFKQDYCELDQVSFWRKFIYPYISPFHVIAICFYSLIFSGFFVCCVLEGPYENWLWFYVATSIFAALINIYSASVACVWLLILILAFSILSAITGIILAILFAIVVAVAGAVFAIAIVILVIVGSSGIALLPLVPIICVIACCYYNLKYDNPNFR